MVGEYCDDQALIQPFFPDLSYWSCGGDFSCAAPEAVLETALYLTVTSTSHEAGPTTSSPPGPVADPLASSRVPLLSSQPTPNVPSVSSPNQQPNQPAPYNPPTPAQSASISPSPGVQPGSINQPAQSKQPAPINLPSVTNTVSHKLPYLGQGPASNNQPAPAQSTSVSPAPGSQPISSNLPSLNDQPVSSQPADNPTSPQYTTIVPIAVASTNAQGSVAVSTTLGAAIAVLQISTNNQGQTSVFTTSRH